MTIDRAERADPPESEDAGSGPWAVFALLALGALACCSALQLYFHRMTELGYSAAFIPLFGLPLIVRELGRRTRWMPILYFALLVPASYYAGMTATTHMVASIQNGNDWFYAGSAGGFCGSALSLIALWLPGLHGPDGRTRRLLVAAALMVLTLLGGLCIIATAATDFDWMPWTLFLPWQIVFAYFLSRLLPPSPPRRAKAPPAAAEPLA